MAPNPMRDRALGLCRRSAMTAAAAIAGMLFAGAASAGTGRLLSNWMSYAPAIGGGTSIAVWGGSRLQPDYYEFWQGRPNRLHDRLCYEKTGGVWTLQRLMP